VPGGAPAPPAGGAPPADDGGGGAPADGNAGASPGGGSGGDSSGGGGSGDGGSGSDGGDEPAPAKVSEWPAGQEGYTVVVYTFNSKSEAKAKARQVAADGLPAGILNSSNFASLDPGSWLVYIGQYDSAKEAERAAAQFDGDYPGEVTYVGDKQSPEYEEPQDGGSSSSSAEPQQQP
jgi:hypothetical protein